jgi:hypothetical protein
LATVCPPESLVCLPYVAYVPASCATNDPHIILWSILLYGAFHSHGGTPSSHL